MTTEMDIIIIVTFQAIYNNTPPPPAHPPTPNLKNCVLLNLLWVCILFQNASSHSCFRLFFFSSFFFFFFSNLKSVVYTVTMTVTNSHSEPSSRHVLSLVCQKSWKFIRSSSFKGLNSCKPFTGLFALRELPKCTCAELPMSA